MSRSTRDPINGEGLDDQQGNPRLVEDTRPAVQDIRQVVDRKIGQATTPLLERIETLECRLDELTGEVDTAAVEGYDSGEA